MAHRSGSIMLSPLSSIALESSKRVPPQDSRMGFDRSLRDLFEDRSPARRLPWRRPSGRVWGVDSTFWTEGEGYGYVGAILYAGSIVLSFDGNRANLSLMLMMLRPCTCKLFCRNSAGVWEGFLYRRNSVGWSVGVRIAQVPTWTTGEGKYCR